MPDDSENSALDRARAYVQSAEGETWSNSAVPLLTAASAYALISIAESLEEINKHGIETYELDADGHRRYR